MNEIGVDILAIAESKLDDSFPSEQFSIPNYKLHRQDRDSHGGGIMIYVNGCIPHRLIKDHTGVYMGIEFMTLEISVKSSKWKLCYIYKPPRVTEKIFCDFLSEMCERFFSDSSLCLFFGDLNCNLYHRNGLSDVCDVFGLTNLIKEPTCFKGDTPTLVDVFLTNRPKCFSGVVNVDIGTSDFHHYVGVVTRAFAPRQIRRKITYRSMKNFQEDAFRADCDNIPFHVSNIFDDIDDIYWAHNQMFLSVLNEHAPLKTKWIKKEQVPYMNSELRKAIHQRNMWRNKHFKNKRDKLARQNYVKLRNKVVKLKKSSIKTYFDRKCNTQFGCKDFYKTVKPFLSDKGSGCNGSNIILREGDVLITDPFHVADVFNTYYASIADYDSVPDGLDRFTFIDAIVKHRNHESIISIRNKISITHEFTFQVISAEIFAKCISKLQNNKAVGHDGLKATFIKLSGFHLCSSLCEIFNMCIATSSFPSEMKLADISPIFKKDDSLCTEAS